MNKPNSLIVTPFTKEEFCHFFSRKKDIKEAKSYTLVRCMFARSSPGDNSFLLIEVDHPGYKYVCWAFRQIPQHPKETAKSGAFYYLPQPEEMWISNHSLQEIMRSIAEESFYDVFVFPDYESATHNKWRNRA